MIKQLRKDLREAYDRQVMADFTLKTHRHSFSKAIQALGKELRKEMKVPSGAWLRTQRIECKDGAAGLGLCVSFSSCTDEMKQRIKQALIDREWQVYDMTEFADKTVIKAY